MCPSGVPSDDASPWHLLTTCARIQHLSSSSSSPSSHHTLCLSSSGRAFPPLLFARMSDALQTLLPIPSCYCRWAGDGILALSPSSQADGKTRTRESWELHLLNGCSGKKRETRKETKHTHKRKESAGEKAGSQSEWETRLTQGTRVGPGFLVTHTHACEATRMMFTS